MLEQYKNQSIDEKGSLEVSRELPQLFKRRRTIRKFSSHKPSQELIENAISVGKLSPSGANRQPWHFCLVSSQELKENMRRLAEEEEYRFYVENPNKRWLNDLKHLHTNEEKAFLTEAPYLIVIFYSHFDYCQESQEKQTNYYAKESVGIATGMLISALHLSGLSTLTYTPKRMLFLNKLLFRPEFERPFMVLGVGYPDDETQVPVLSKKSLNQVMTIFK